MAARRALLGLALAGCATATGPASDTGFRVAGSVPAPDATDVAEAQTPELRFNASADAETCIPGALGLYGVNDAGDLVYEPDWTLSLEDDGSKARFTHDRPFLNGYRYALVATSACTDVDGRPLRPFGSEFSVP